jgi:hypothetical protein
LWPVAARMALMASPIVWSRESRLVRSETDFRKNHALIQSLRVSLSRFFDSKKTGQTLKELDALYQPVA